MPSHVVGIGSRAAHSGIAPGKVLPASVATFDVAHMDARTTSASSRDCVALCLCSHVTAAHRTMRRGIGGRGAQNENAAAQRLEVRRSVLCLFVFNFVCLIPSSFFFFVFQRTICHL